ncbi:MAG: PDZ domain-containing protein [Chloroflexi bacterium]|nr:MAG: PDZ domain-containing protein [Chloroflexota bacterium]
MAALSDLSRDIAGILERAAAGIVRVDARRGRPATGIVWGSNLVLTAEHVIEHDEAIQVSAGGTAVKASVAGRDPGTDLALLKTDGLTAAPLARAASAEVRIGHLVLAVGRTSELQVTLGIVSGLSGAFRSWRGGETERLIQTTAELLPGFSGGPLLDGDGRVIGINSWNFGRGVTRAIPIETAATVAENLQTHGRIRRAYLGLGAQPVRLGEALRSQLGQESGLLVVTVEAGGPAAKSGLMQGDTLVKVDGDPVRQLDELFGKLRGLDVGSTHRFGVVRGGELKDVSVSVGERSS